MRRASTTLNPFVTVAAVAVLAVVGAGFLVVRLAAGPGEKQRIADAFRSARPPSFLPDLPQVPDVDENDEVVPDTPGAATAWVRSYDTAVRVADDGLLAMQGRLRDWAHGSATDADLRVAIAAMRTALAVAAAPGTLASAPASLRPALTTLRTATADYDTALASLLDWLGTRAGSSRAGYHLAVAKANAHWDAAITAMYGTAHLPVPPLPHPAKR